MKKKLDAATIVNELRGQSVFFPTKQVEEPPVQEQVTQHPKEKENMTSRHHDPMIPSNHDTMIPISEE